MPLGRLDVERRLSLFGLRRSIDTRRFARYQNAVVVFLLFDMTRIDIAFSNLLYDPLHQVFPLEHVRLFEKITHKWARIIPNWTGEAATICVLLSFVWPIFKPKKCLGLLRLLEKIRFAAPLRFAHKHRRDFLYVVFAFFLSTGVVHYLKGHTSVYCPVETTQYAGKIEHKEWFQNFDLLKITCPTRSGRGFSSG